MPAFWSAAGSDLYGASGTLEIEPSQFFRTGAAAGATLGAWEVGIVGVTACLRFRALIKAGAKL